MLQFTTPDAKKSAGEIAKAIGGGFTSKTITVHIEKLKEHGLLKDNNGKY